MPQSLNCMTHLSQLAVQTIDLIIPDTIELKQEKVYLKRQKTSMNDLKELVLSILPGMHVDQKNLAVLRISDKLL